MFDLYNNMPVLITGGLGFIGSHLAEALVLLGAHVTILDNQSTGKRENIQSIHNQITLIDGDVTDIDVCLKSTKDQKIVFHLAAHTSILQSMENPYQCHHGNTVGTLNMLEASRKHGISRFVFSSSAAVYGFCEGICTEDTPCKPTSTYGYSKYLGELLCNEFSNLHNLSTIALRYFNVYGPRQRFDTAYSAVVAHFSYLMQSNKPLTIFGDGLQTRDFVPVLNIVQANLIMGILPHSPHAPFQVFNVASGKAITILELIAHLKEIFPGFDQPIHFAPQRPGEIYHSGADCTKLKAVLDCLPAQGSFAKRNPNEFFA